MRKKMAEINWPGEWEGREVNDMWIILKNHIKDLMEKHVPMKSKKECMFVIKMTLMCVKGPLLSV